MIYTKNLEKVTLVMQMTKQTGTFIVGFVLWYSGSQLGDLRAQPGLKKHTSATQNFICYYRLFLFLGFWLACKILDSFTFLGRKKLTNRTSWEGKERSRGIYGSEMFYQIWYRPVKKKCQTWHDWIGPQKYGPDPKNADDLNRGKQKYRWQHDKLLTVKHLGLERASVWWWWWWWWNKWMLSYRKNSKNNYFTCFKD